MWSSPVLGTQPPGGVLGCLHRGRGKPGCSTAAARSAAAGSCAIVSAGPGAADLITVRGARLLAAADVVVYDSLGAEGLLGEFVPPGAERCFVGKRGGRPSPRQPEIDALLVQRCLAGKRVVRLKGGCVSVFSRVASEVAALEAAGIPCQLVPGVSSPSAAALDAGLSLTAAGGAAGFSVHSAHDLAALDWRRLRCERHTLAFLMAGRSLLELRAALLERSGLPPDAPVVVVRDASLPSQRVWRTSLGSDEFEGLFQGEALSPAVVLVGPVD